MTDEAREMDLMRQKIVNGVRLLSPATALMMQGVMKTLQYLIRRYKENRLSKGEIEAYKKFVHLTNAQYTIKNIPWENQVSFEEFKERLSAANIAFSVMPKQNDDSKTQIAVYDRDAKKFETLFADYIEKQLSGGEKDNKVLRELTKGHSQIISVPIEDKEFIKNTLKPDLEKLKVNYAVMPDLKVGDGYSQLLVAEQDVHSVREWFEQYRTNLLKEGKSTNEMVEMSNAEYQSTANLTHDEYIKLDPTHKELSQKYDKNPEIGEALSERANMEKSADSILFEKKYNDPGLTMISVDKKTLVENDPVCKTSLSDASASFKCRIPGSSSSGDAAYLTLPKENVFLYSQKNERPTYLCFVSKFERPCVLNAKGESHPQYTSVLHAIKRFDDAREELKRSNIQDITRHLQALNPKNISKGGVTL